jgi:uncharacterized protein DUF4349/putative zinc finger protein
MGRTDHFVEPEELMAYLDGELPPDRAAAAGAHLEVCRDCRAMAADFQSVSRRMMEWQVETSTPQMTAGLATSLREHKPRNAAHLTWWSWLTANHERPWNVGLAAAGICVVALVLVSRPGLRSLWIANGVLPKQSAREAPGPHVNVVSAIPVAVAQRPMIVRSAQLTLTTAEFDKARDRIEQILKRHRGYIGELNVSAAAGAARALDATLRVPADQLETAVAELKKLGRVDFESQRGEEVTQQYVDLEARLSNARKTEQRLTDLLRERTGKLADVLAVEKEMDEVRESIERMEAERKNLGNRVDFAALTVRVTEDYNAQMQVVPASLFTRFRNAAVEGYRSMVEGLVDMLLVLLSYGPSALIWGALLFFPVRIVWRRLRRDPLRQDE